MDQEPRSRVRVSQSRQGIVLGHEVLHDTLVPSLFPVRPRPCPVHDENPGISEQAIPDDFNVLGGPPPQRLGSLDATKQRACMQCAETVPDEGAEIMSKSAPHIGDGERVAGVAWRKIPSNRMPK